MITITLTEEERKELEKCLIVSIERLEDRLEKRRGDFMMEGVLLERISNMQSVLNKIQ